MVQKNESVLLLDCCFESVEKTIVSILGVKNKSAQVVDLLEVKE
ncbi:hypothetical protein IGI49_002061 [Enterococcus sp. AZ071]